MLGLRTCKGNHNTETDLCHNSMNVPPPSLEHGILLAKHDASRFVAFVQIVRFCRHGLLAFELDEAHPR